MGALEAIEATGLSIDTLRIWARLASWKAHFTINTHHVDEGIGILTRVKQELAHDSWSGLDVRWEEALVDCFMLLAWVRTKNEQALECARRSADLFYQCGDHWYSAKSLAYGAAALESLGRFSEQIQRAERALALQTPGGDPELIHSIRYVLGCGYIYNGKLEEGVRLIDESIADPTSSDEKLEIAQKTLHQAVNRGFVGNYQEALALMELGYSIYREQGKPCVCPWRKMALFFCQVA